MTPATQVLERLLASAERAYAKAIPAKSMSMDTCREYDLSSLDALETFHAEIALAERHGAIHVTRSRTGDEQRLVKLRVVNLDLLGEHLTTVLLSAKVDKAAIELDPWLNAFPIISHILERWRAGKKVRKKGPEAFMDLRDAIEVVRTRTGRGETIVRRESVRLFGDSKRLEKLTPWLDILTSDELKPSGLLMRDIWGSLGLRREPQPILIAGQGFAELDDGPIRLCRPYIGLSADAVRSIRVDARFLLTIENLATFHDTARSFSHTGGVILYTAGMPSPSWQALYANMLASLSPTTPVFHWGDIDEGGFRIAATLAKVAQTQGHSLQPWCMAPSTLPAGTRTASPPSAATLAQMIRWAGIAGWDVVATELLTHPVRVEQEALAPSAPPSSLDSDKEGRHKD